MDKRTTKYFLIFIAAFFTLSFIGVAIYQNILGSSKSYVLNKAKKRFYNDQSAWESLFSLCSEINRNNKSKDLIIRYYINQERIDCNDKTAKDSKGEIIRNWNTSYPDLYILMHNLDVSYAAIGNKAYTFSLRGIPGNPCLIVFLNSSNDSSSLPIARKWEYKINDNVFIVAIKE